VHFGASGIEGVGMLQQNPDGTAAELAEVAPTQVLFWAGTLGPLDRLDEAPWGRVFEITPTVPDHKGAILLAQVDRKRFLLGSTITFVGETGLEGKPKLKDALDAVRTVTPLTMPITDLASVPVPLRWFVETYGAHTPAAIVHDSLIGNPNRPKVMTDIYADRYFRFMLKAVGVSWLRRHLMWTAVALRTRWAAEGAKWFIRWRNRLGLVLWGLLSILGMTAAVVALVQGSWLLGAAAIALPVPACLLWGRQCGAGVVAVFAAPWLLPPSGLAVIGYGIYWLIERVLSWFGLGGLEFRIVQSAPSAADAGAKVTASPSA
jgi:hypothetical protein